MWGQGSRQGAALGSLEPRRPSPLGSSRLCWGLVLQREEARGTPGPETPPPCVLGVGDWREVWVLCPLRPRAWPPPL